MDEFTIHQDFCALCHRLFHFHWQLVPSLTVSGLRLPVCEECIEQINTARIVEGIEPLHAHPDAYAHCGQGDLYE